MPIMSPIRKCRFISVLWGIVFIFATLGGCATLSDTKISESTAPANVATTNDETTTGSHQIIIIGEKIRSTNKSDMRAAAITEGKQRCTKFTIDSEKYRTGEEATSVMRGIRGPWLEMYIVCADAPRKKVKGSAVLVIENESKRLSDTDFFDIHAEPFSREFEKVYAAVVAVLKSQGDDIYRVDKNRGFIMTGRARHGLIGFPIYEQYVIVVDEVSASQSKVTFKLLVHSPNFKMGTVADMPPVERKFVYKRAAAFVDNLRSALK